MLWAADPHQFGPGKIHAIDDDDEPDCAECAFDAGRKDAAKTEENLRERVRALTDELAELRSQKK